MKARVRIHDKMAILKNRFKLKKENKERDRETIVKEATEKIMNERLKRKKEKCVELKEKIQNTTHMNDYNNNEIEVPEELKEELLELLEKFENYNFFRLRIRGTEIENTIVYDYLNFDENGISLATEMYGTEPDTHQQTHLYEPEEILYKYSIIREEKKQKVR